MKLSSLQHSYINVEVSIETKKEEYKSVVFEEFEFEYRDKSVLKALFLEFSGYQNFDAKIKLNEFVANVDFSSLGLDGKNTNRGEVCV